MCEATTAIAAVGLLVGTGSTVVAQRQQKKARRSQQRIADLQADRQRRAQLREARIRRAQVENIAAQTGTAESSGEIGATGAIQSQLASNLSFLDQTQTLSNRASSALQSASDIQSFGAVTKALTSAEGQKVIKTIFE